MDWVTLKAGEWLPDLPDLDNAGATLVKNCYPAAGSYRPIKSLEAYTEATGTSDSDYVRGALSMKDGTSTARVYAGDAGKLYSLSAVSWTDISVAGAYSGTATNELWRFALYGPSLVVATNYNNVPQKIVPGSAAVALGGNPPRARYVAQVRDWIVFANTNDGSPRPNRVQWSGYNNAEYWGRSVALQADYQDLYEGGHISGLAESNGMGVVISESAVHLMTYQGPPVTWKFDRVANALGTKVPGSVISHSDRVWWFGESDIWEFSGQGMRGIATERVAKYFFDDFDAAYKHRVSATVDPINSLVIWAYPGQNHSGGVPNRLLIYSWNTNRFTYAELDTECLMQFLTPGYTIESLDTLSSSIETLPASLDSDFYKGGQLSLAAFEPNKVLSAFAGTPLTAVIDTAELRAQPGRFNEATNTRPLHEGGVARVSLGIRNEQSDSITWKGPKSPNNSGECNIRANGRFMRARLELSGDWSHAIGVDVYLRSGNKR